MPARTLIARILPVAAIAAGLLVASPAADAKSKKKDKPVIAKIALGDKRVKKAHASAKKPKAKTSQTPAPCQNTDVLPTPDNVELVRAAILCLHNQIRANRGLPLLRENARLRRAAAAHSADMVSRGFFEHTTPSGVTMVDRIMATRYASPRVGWAFGENLAWGTGSLATPRLIMKAWMESSGHRANVVRRAYREIGIGVVTGVPSDRDAGATYTADFGVVRR